MVEVICHGRSIASHGLSYESGELLLDPLHNLTLLDRKPAYLDHTDVYKNWRLANKFQDLRANIEARHGKATVARKFIQVLQLLLALRKPQGKLLHWRLAESQTGFGVLLGLRIQFLDLQPSVSIGIKLFESFGQSGDIPSSGITDKFLQRDRSVTIRVPIDEEL